MMVNIIRLRNAFIDDKRLQKVLSELVGVTRFKKHATDEEIPYSANCVTALRYILVHCAIYKNTGEFFRYPNPHPFVGSLARRLLEYKQADIAKTDLPQCGDLLFLKQPYSHFYHLISHVAFCLNDGKIFHVNRNSGAVIENISEILKRCTCPDELTLRNYIDYRSPNSSYAH